MGRALGVDLGSRRVGLALSDPHRIICSPFTTIPFRSENGLVRELLRICAAREVDLVVIGMPVSADGAEGPGCERARRIRRNLDEAGVRVELQDEAWTSRGAEAILRAVGKKREKAKAKIDAVAASLILRDHLDGTASV